MNSFLSEKSKENVAEWKHFLNNSFVWFSHFVKITYPLKTKHLCRFFESSTGVITQDFQRGVDIVIPVLHLPNGKFHQDLIKEENMSAILLDSKNYQRCSDYGVRRKARMTLSKDNCGLDIKQKYISVYFQLALHTSFPNFLRKRIELKAAAEKDGISLNTFEIADEQLHDENILERLRQRWKPEQLVAFDTALKNYINLRQNESRELSSVEIAPYSEYSDYLQMILPQKSWRKAYKKFKVPSNASNEDIIQCKKNIMEAGLDETLVNVTVDAYLQIVKEEQNNQLGIFVKGTAALPCINDENKARTIEKIIKSSRESTALTHSFPFYSHPGRKFMEFDSDLSNIGNLPSPLSSGSFLTHPVQRQSANSDNSNRESPPESKRMCKSESM